MRTKNNIFRVFSNLKQKLTRPFWSLATAVCALAMLAGPVQVFATNSQILTPFYDPELCDPSLNGGVANTQTSQSDKDIAKIIIGVVKSYNLNQKAASIALITALVESNLKVYANKNIALSLALPHTAVGSDHDSVGVFQQRPTAGWSTFSKGGNSALTDKNTITQLMDTAYNAQAFLGTPPGAQLPAGLINPNAIKKGLQNKKGWESMNEGAAAQAVQGSAFPDRYIKRLPQAQKLINDLWNDSPAVPLPIPVTGGSAPTTEDTNVNGATCTPPAAAGGAASGNLFQVIQAYAWPSYRKAGSSNAMERKPEYASAITAAVQRKEYVGSCNGVDCGGFVTRAMRDSGKDPKYNDKQGNTTAQMAYMQRHPELYKEVSSIIGKTVSSTAELQPGDIAVTSGHTYFFVGSIPGFNGNSASASQCSRAPMASDVYDIGKWHWFRMIGGAAK